MHILISIIGILLTIFFVIGTHEAAHFLVAKILGVKVLRFSIGFGKPLKSWYDKSGTEYVIAPIPLGGYVRMLDESEGNVPTSELPHAYNRQPFYKKFLIVAAGPVCNLLCALVLYWIIFMIGFVTIKPIIGTVLPNSIAAHAGMKPNQVIQQVDNQTTNSWTGIIFRLLSHTGNQDHLTIQVLDEQNNKQETKVLDLTNWKMSELNPDPLSSLGILPYEPIIPLIIGLIAPESPAAASELKIGDKIRTINHKTVTSWEEVMQYIYKHPNELIDIGVVRAGKSITVPVKIGYQRNLFAKHGWLGIGPKFSMPPNLLSKIQYSPLPAIQHAYRQVHDLIYLNLLLFGKMLSGKLSLQSLGGPITIFDSAGDALNSGMLAFISFLAFLSIAIGVVNFLPIPGLDGGHLFLQLIELVIRRPIPDKVLGILFQLGFFFLLFMLIQALANDLLRIY